MKTLQDYRNEIENIDLNIIELLAKRFKTVLEIGKYKKDQSLDIIDKDFENEKLEKLMVKGQENNLDKNLIKELWNIIFKYAHILEK